MGRSGNTAIGKANQYRLMNADLSDLNHRPEKILRRSEGEMEAENASGSVSSTDPLKVKAGKTAWVSSAAADELPARPGPGS